MVRTFSINEKARTKHPRFLPNLKLSLFLGDFGRTRRRQHQRILPGLNRDGRIPDDESVAAFRHGEKIIAVGFYIFQIRFAACISRNIVGGVFAAGTALVTKSPGAALAVIGVMALIQLIDDYFIEPYIVGSQVNLSPLAIIVILVIGGLLWGVAGMILFIPLLGIAKVIFDHVPSLQPYGYLIGDDKKEDDNSFTKKIKDWFQKRKQAA